MKIVSPSVEIIAHTPFLMETIEKAGRTSYKSEDKITKDSAIPFVKKMIALGHESVLEHGSITVRFITDRGVSHELVRHRIASFTQESTRYCKYGEDVTFCEPFFITYAAPDSEVMKAWREQMLSAEAAYKKILAQTNTDAARSVLPQSVKTEVVMTANPREWRHFLILRTSHRAHPDMRYLARELLYQFKKSFPGLFDDIEVEY